MYFDYSSSLAFTFFHAWESKRKHSFMVSIMLLNRLMGIVKLSSFVPTYGRTDGSSKPMKHLCPCRAFSTIVIETTELHPEPNLVTTASVAFVSKKAQPQRPESMSGVA